jgi:GNAT superfamily N-acetyltransferase
VIALIDPKTAPVDVLDGVYDLRRRAAEEASPDAPFDSRADIVAMMRNPPATTAVWNWVAGAPAYGFAQVRVVNRNRTARVRLIVAPERRRTGLGRALLAAVVDRARAERCMLIEGATGVAAGEAFTMSVGGRLGRTYLPSLLRLPARPVAVAPPVGYRLISWTGTVDDSLLVSYARARSAIADAPVDPGVTPTRWTPESVRAVEESVLASGQQVRVTAALDAAGDVVAFTEIRVRPERGAVAGTDDTAVTAAHRGRGLATWVKAESLRLLALDRPDVTVVTTTNSADNGPMLAVNRRLGFEVSGRLRGATLPLARR